MNIGLSTVVFDNSQVQLTLSPPSDHSICITKFIPELLVILQGTRQLVLVKQYWNYQVFIRNINVHNISVAGVDKRFINNFI